MAKIALADGKWQVELTPEIGGSISLCRYDGQDILRPAVPASPATVEARDMSCFPLVPFSNRIENGVFSFQGEHITLPRNMGDHPHPLHGQGWRGAWTVETQKADLAVLEYRHDADSWPWRYASRQTFRFEPDSFIVDLSVANLSETPMPVGLGLHPYFPKSEGVTLTAPVTHLWETTSQQIPIRLIDVPEALDFTRGIRIADVDLDHCFAGWGRSAVIAWPGRRWRVNMTGDSNLRFLIVYTPSHENFFCVEGVENMNNAVNWLDRGADTGLKILRPGESHTVTTTFTVEPAA